MGIQFRLFGALVSALPSLAGLFGVVSKRAMDAVALLKDELHKATGASHRCLITARKVAMK